MPKGEVVRGDALRPVIALTFDCGSADGPTATILDLLKQYNLHITFFVTGQYAERYPALVKRIVAEGHELANHTYSHLDLTTLPDAKVRSELLKAEAAFQQAAGQDGKPWMRMPFGARDGRVLGIITQLGYTSVYWTIDSGDWREEATTQRVRDKVLGSIENGGIVVQHCNAPQSAEALPSILEGLKSKGLTVVTVSALFGVNPSAAAAATPTAAPSATASSTPSVSATPVSSPSPEASATALPHPFLAPMSKTYALEPDYEPSDLVDVTEVLTVRSETKLRAAAYQAVKEMLAAAEEEDVRIYVLSAYRSYQKQAEVYEEVVEHIGEEEAARVSAKPGHSEHQLGTTIDFTTPRVDYDLVESFGATPEGEWLAQNAGRFGFVMSYPQDKEQVTGYAYEPWHFRYVGVDVAAAVAESGLTLYEYLLDR